MKTFKSIFFILTLFLGAHMAYTQEFVDDLYFNDTEVDYSFLYANSVDEEWNEDFDNTDSVDSEWGEEISFEDRIRKFHNPYYLDYYWDYGWSSPTWHNWHYPSWGYTTDC